ncbi:alkaline phosphatase family protein [Leekyejoonella antrihumi]|uniref:Phosphoesterase n=1 Tax=Leekyejoonella antrihumi TaxID=1660198 RepID=A0A563DTL8_9MICO|nr:alkaline phosphatase family protein [Leekyejoonella antrihumi]TWP33608.1 hypothetical protein FGL98_20485 [Leekyejoonella antrihumi]
MRRHRTVLMTVAAAATAVLAVGALSAASGYPAAALPAASSTASGGSAWRGGGSQRLDHVFIIMEENHSQDHTIGDINPATGKLSMPFLTKLSSEYGQATNYYGVTHTSEPNYIAATSGSIWDVNNDDEWYPDASYKFGVNHYDHTNIVDELDASHIPWAAYMQAMPKAGYLPDSWPTTGSALYVTKHNPFILYNDIHDNPTVARNIQPYSNMASELNSRHAPRYVWISPDLCTDMHLGVYNAVKGFPETPCQYSNSINDPIDEHSKTVADNFIKHAVTTITHSRAWTGNSAIFITADETDFDAANGFNGQYLSTAGCCDSPSLPAGDPEISASWPGGLYGGGLVPMVVISRNGPRHVTDTTAYNHYSMLLTIEEGLGLGKLGNTSDAAQVKPMWSLITGGHRR